MKLEEAIKELTYLKNHDYVREGAPNHEAIKLGIEALKRLGDMRTSPCTTADEILPGETK